MMKKLISFSRPRRWLVVLSVFGMAGITAGLAFSSSGSGPTLPPAKQAILNANPWPPAGAAPPAPKDPSAIPPAPAPSPPPDAGQILLASKTPLQVPIPAGLFNDTSGWSSLRGSTLLEVFAGADGQDPTVGEIFVAASNQGSGLQVDPSGLYKDSAVAGPLTLTAVSGNTVSFEAQGGAQGTFDLGTKTFTNG